MGLYDYCVAAVFCGPIVLGIVVVLIKVFA
jgi:hypothetical protein